jgi:hypothetical protein
METGSKSWKMLREEQRKDVLSKKPFGIEGEQEQDAVLAIENRLWEDCKKHKDPWKIMGGVIQQVFLDSVISTEQGGQIGDRMVSTCLLHDMTLTAVLTLAGDIKRLLMNAPETSDSSGDGLMAILVQELDMWEGLAAKLVNELVRLEVLHQLQESPAGRTIQKALFENVEEMWEEIKKEKGLDTE